MVLSDFVGFRPESSRVQSTGGAFKSTFRHKESPTSVQFATLRCEPNEDLVGKLCR